MQRTLFRTTTLLCCLCLLLTACGKDDKAEDSGPPPPPAPARGAPDDVPVYSEDADAKETGYEVTETEIIMTMETINGPISPITYYRKIGEQGWKIVQDIGDNEGTIIATKKKRTLEITFEALPGGAGTIIVLKTTKE